MNEIHVLENSIINKIAAGEVVERPASVVKELVENSIDAGATNVTVEIKDGGISLIRITDNGKGIPKNQVRTAFLRHATSKIESFEDLEGVLTLGFRGEALSSIASVAQVEMITKTKDDETGTRIEIAGGSFLSEHEVGAVEGTTFIMRNLFFNTPARRKFLKKPSVESGQINDIINRIALGHPGISFKYINNNSTIIHTSGNNDLRTCVFHVYGREVSKKMLDVCFEKNGYKLDGLIGRPELNRANRSYGSFFINGRYIKSKIVNDAIEEAYKGKLMVGKFPVFVLNLAVPFNTVDVNVHPTKLEVRFSDEDFIFDLIYTAVSDAFKGQNLIPSAGVIKGGREKLFIPFEPEKEQAVIEDDEAIELLIAEEDKTNAENNGIEKKSLNYDLNTSDLYENIISVNEPDTLLIEEEKQSDFKRAIDEIYTTEKEAVNKTIENKAIEFKDTNSVKSFLEEKSAKPFFKNYKIIGQIFNTYWIIEQDGYMYMVDQHAAHERVLHEELTARLKAGKAVSQRLLSSVPVNLSEKEKNIVKENMILLTEFGFEMEEFGANEYALKSVPFIFKNPADIGFFVDIIDILSEKNIDNIYDTKYDAIATMACKAAVKGNNRLSYIEAKELIENVIKLENPFSCPHGRPTIIKMSKYDIEKNFKRIQ